MTAIRAARPKRLCNRRRPSTGCGGEARRVRADPGRRTRGGLELRCPYQLQRREPRGAPSPAQRLRLDVQAGGTGDHHRGRPRRRTHLLPLMRGAARPLRTRSVGHGGFGLLPLPMVDAPPSYRFQQLSVVWGWASWRRAWSCYHADLASIEAAFRAHPGRLGRAMTLASARSAAARLQRRRPSAEVETGSGATFDGPRHLRRSTKHR